jgi:hypothetical protein
MAGLLGREGSPNLTQETLSWRQGRGGPLGGVGQRGRREAMRRNSDPCVSRYIMGTGPRWGPALETA